MARYTFAEALYGNRIVTFITDGDPYLTARSMGEYQALRLTEIPDCDGDDAAEERGDEGPRDLAERRYRELSQKVVARRQQDEGLGVGDPHLGARAVDDEPRRDFRDMRVVHLLRSLVGKGDEP